MLDDIVISYDCHCIYDKSEASSSTCVLTGRARLLVRVEQSHIDCQLNLLSLFDAVESSDRLTQVTLQCMSKALPEDEHRIPADL